MKTPASSPVSKRGFSLAEMLVSIAVLALIMAMVGQIVSSASQAIANANKLLNCDDQARLIFGRMASDFSRMLKRSDIDIIFNKQTGSTTLSPNDSIYFVTQGSGTNTSAWYTGASQSLSTSLLTLAGYSVAPDAQGATINANVATTVNDLLRLGHAISWDTYSTSHDNLVYVSFAAPTASSSTSALITSTTLDGHWGASAATPTLGAPSSSFIHYLPPAFGSAGTNAADYHTIGDQVFRLEYCFLLKDGTYSNVPVMTSIAASNTAGSGPPAPTNDNTNTIKYTAGSRWFDATNGRAFVCVSGIPNNAVWTSLGVQDVSAIIVAIAMLDRDSRKTFTSATDYNTNLPSLLTDYPTTSAIAATTNPTATSPLLMQQAWQTTVNGGSTFVTAATGAGISASLAGRLAAHIRIYQRFFYLNANTH